MKIIFIVLHYLEENITKECINSILKTQTNYKYKIIVVDNGSNNNSVEELEKYYYQEEKVEIIKLAKNLGFSAGNNMGYFYVKKKYDFKYLCFLNNDTILKTKNIYQILKIKDKDSDVIGTTIWNTAKHFNHNYFYVISSLQEALREERKNKINYILSKYNLFIFMAIFQKILNKLKKREFIAEQNKGFHGSALIFTKNYTNKYEKIFLEKSFLYYEESFLNYRILKDNLKKLYIPEILIEHKESISTKEMLKTKNKKWKFQSYYMKIAIEELVKLYKEKEKKNV